MTKEGYIENIQKKLANGIQLDGDEIRTVIAALRESNHCYQEPYYEVVYHDEYGNQEYRIMNPEHISYRSDPLDPNFNIVDEKFSINFRRIVRKEDM